MRQGQSAVSLVILASLAMMTGLGRFAASWAETPARERVTIGAVDNLLSALSMVGVSRGFFTKHGLDADLKLFRSGQEVAKALQAGDIGIGTSAMNNFQTEIQGGLDHVAYIVIMGDGASRDNDRPLAITAAPGSGIQKPQDLKGKTVGLSLGGTAELYLRAVMEKAQLRDEDVKMVQVVPANSAEALRAKQVDAISAWEPWNTQAQEIPGTVVVARGGGYFNYVIFGLAKKATYRQRPDLIKRVAEGMAESAWFIRKNPRDAAAAVSTWLPSLSVPVLEAGLKNVPFDVRITDYTRFAWDTSYRFLSRFGKLKGPVPMTGYVDTRQLNLVIRENPQWFADLKDVPLLQLQLR